MPFSQREAIQLGLLLLSVPVQYFLSGNSGTGRSQTLPELKYLQDVWFKFESWKVKWLQFVSWMLRGKTCEPIFHHFLSSPFPLPPCMSTRIQSKGNRAVSFKF
jgi:hypothetical protein